VLYGGGLFALIALGLWIYCIFDVISTEESQARNLPKIMWLLIVIFVPTVGSIAWLILGRPSGAGFAPGDRSARTGSRQRTPRALGPDDDPGFLSELDERRRKLQRWEDDLTRREQELKSRDEEDPEQPSS
jgi:hypothetical protein